MIYFRTNRHTLFILPTMAIGTEMGSGTPFLEFAWLFWAVGIGEAARDE
ncbi:hypothetical protein [Algiphilus aromaticivorans]|nr:hypothetical protein [Algiphilus aromaticivorans]